MESRFLPGIGTFIREPHAPNQPEDVTLWRLAEPPVSTLYDEPVAVGLVLERADGVEDLDLSLVPELVTDVDRYVEAALRFVHQKLLEDPAFFGITELEAGRYREFSAKEFPLNRAPEITVYTDSWTMRFDGTLPVCDPAGLLVTCAAGRPVSVDDIRHEYETSLVECGWCGCPRMDASPVEALAWVVENGEHGQTWLCPACARTHVRDIEGKLPTEYW